MESVHMFYHAKMKWKVTESMFVLTRKNMLKCIHTSEQSLHPMLSTPTHLITRLYKMHCWARHTYLFLSLHSWNTSFLSLCVTVYAFVTTLSIHLSETFFFLFICEAFVFLFVCVTLYVPDTSLSLLCWHVCLSLSLMYLQHLFLSFVLSLSFCILSSFKFHSFLSFSQLSCLCCDKAVFWRNWAVSANRKKSQKFHQKMFLKNDDWGSMENFIKY